MGELVFGKCSFAPDAAYQLFKPLCTQSLSVRGSNLMFGGVTRASSPHHFPCLASRGLSPTKVSKKGFSGGKLKSSKNNDLRMVLELASDSELIELCSILYGRSMMSPLLKSFINRDDPEDIVLQIGDPQERETLLDRLESRFLFLAGDAKATLSGQRPSYYEVLLQVRKKLKVPCSNKLSTEDLEAEIFLHLLEQYSRKPKKNQEVLSKSVRSQISEIRGVGPAPVSWQEHVLAAFKLGANELLSLILKGGSALTLLKLQDVIAKELSGQMILESAKYEVSKQMIKQGGKVVATRLENQIALLTAKQGIARATLQYALLRNIMTVLGPLSWGTLLADLTIKALGTDYLRILRAIYIFAQIRLTCTYGWESSKDQTSNNALSKKRLAYCGN